MKEWAEWFYQGKQWRRTSKEYMRSQDGICERCGCPAKIVHHKTYLTKYNIHDTNITLSWDNLEALCQDCHNKEHHRKDNKAKRYKFDKDGNLIQR